MTADIRKGLSQNITILPDIAAAINKSEPYPAEICYFAAAPSTGSMLAVLVGALCVCQLRELF